MQRSLADKLLVERNNAGFHIGEVILDESRTICPLVRDSHVNSLANRWQIHVGSGKLIGARLLDGIEREGGRGKKDMKKIERKHRYKKANRDYDEDGWMDE